MAARPATRVAAARRVAEHLDTEHHERVYSAEEANELLPETRLINGYGPTESVTFACCLQIPRNLSAESRSVPIGTPIANTTVFLLDDKGRLALPGCPAELTIGGDGLARC